MERQAAEGLELNDYQLAGYEHRFSDGPGVSMITNDKKPFIESSSGINKQNISYNLDDVIRIIIEYSNILKCIIKKNKNVSIEKIDKKEICSLQRIL